MLKGGLQVTAHGVEKKKKKKRKAPALEDLTEEEKKQLEEKSTWLLQALLVWTLALLEQLEGRSG